MKSKTDQLDFDFSRPIDFQRNISSDIIDDCINELFKKEGIEYLLEKLKTSDQKYFKIVDKKNHRRVIRALEIIQYTNKPYSSYLTNKKKNINNYSLRLYGLCPSKVELKSRINVRVDKMVEMGLFKEVEKLKKYQELNPLRSVGYSEIFSYLKGKISKKEAIDLIKINTWRYSKRQITWFKRNKDIQWYRSSTELVKGIKN